MRTKRASIEDLKDDIDILTVITELGGEVQRYGWGGRARPTKCPFHDDREASATVYDDGRFMCHACGAPRDDNKPGDIIDVAKYHLQTNSITEAINWLRSEFL